ncbi:MAG: SDR family NAD(P)-dependent oxidoreductase [Gammaproteobacteria bacterium]|nr:SDR family NAD(P)-dependent oxidoreductase [Gammaproteobacteria bacterium]
MTIVLKGQVALITGAARGLGLSIARKLAERGVHICGTDLRFDLLQNELSSIEKEYGVETLAIAADVSEESDVCSAVEQVYKRWNKIDILVNNAGLRMIGLLHETSVDTWETMQNVNLKGQFLFTREVLKQGMLEKNEGTLIFLSSDAGLHGSKNSGAYGASKWGVIGLAETTAKETKRTNIRVSTIAPGRVWTPMAEESEVADADLDWLDVEDVTNAVMYCIDQKAGTIIPLLSIMPRSQI